MRTIQALALAWAALLTGETGLAAATIAVLEAEDAQLNPARAEIVRQESFRGQKGAALKSGVAALVDTLDRDADLVFKIKAPQAGRYSLSTYAATDAAGAEQMRRARSKFESLYLRIQIDDQRPTRRVVFVPWGEPQLCAQQTGTFTLSGAPQEIRCWLPSGVRLDRQIGRAHV